MKPFWSLLMVVHLVGLAIGVGGATAKVGLLLRCSGDPAFVPIYLRVARPLTRQIVSGLILLTLSGIGWVLLGYPVRSRLAVKLGLVAAIWVVGPFIDKVVEPRFRRLAPETGEPPSPAFIRVRGQYLMLEVLATLLFYATVVVWVLG